MQRSNLNAEMKYIRTQLGRPFNPGQASAGAGPEVEVEAPVAAPPAIDVPAQDHQAGA